MVPANGGEPRLLATSAGDPVWCPAGRAVLVFSQELRDDGTREVDWWWVPVDGGEAVRTGAMERLAAAGIDLGLNDFALFPEEWTDAGVFFTARRAGGTTTNIWVLPIDERSGRVAGQPRQVTAGLGQESGPSLSSDNRLVVAGLTNHFAVVGLPLDADAGVPTGPLRTLRTDFADRGRAAPSWDGRYVVIPVFTDSGTEMWILDLQTSEQSLLTVAPPGAGGPDHLPLGPNVVLYALGRGVRGRLRHARGPARPQASV